MDETQLLKQRVEKLESIILTMAFSDRFSFLKHIQMLEGRNFQLGINTGTKIGTALGQKLGLWGVTPVVQPSTTGTTAGFTAGDGGTAVKDVSTFTGNTGSTAYTIGDIVNALKKSGIMLT